MNLYDQKFYKITQNYHAFYVLNYYKVHSINAPKSNENFKFFTMTPC